MEPSKIHRALKQNTFQNTLSYTFRFSGHLRHFVSLTKFLWCACALPSYCILVLSAQRTHYTRKLSFKENILYMFNNLRPKWQKLEKFYCTFMILCIGLILKCVFQGFFRSISEPLLEKSKTVLFYSVRMIPDLSYLCTKGDFSP
mgnify:CR=1 FL=1